MTTSTIGPPSSRLWTSNSGSLPCAEVSTRAIVLSPCSSLGSQRFYSQFNVGSVKCAVKAQLVVCKSNSGGNRRNPDFSRQNKQNFSRNRNNRQSEDRDTFENFDETDVLSSKNGPFLSFSGTSKFHAAATPGPREKEIVELFRKVQAQLRERAAIKEERKVETSQGRGRENETVDSLLKLLRKHSIEQGKKKISNINDGDLVVDQPEHTVLRSRNRTTGSFNVNRTTGSFKGRDTSREPKAPYVSRPPSNFQRRSPVPRVKFQPIYPREDTVSSTDINTREEEQQFEVLPVNAEEPEQELDLEPDEEPPLELESSLPGGDMFDEFLEGDDSDSSDAEDIEDDSDKQQENANEDLSSWKLPELRALAKSRGIKGFSKMKKRDLVELLSGGTT